MGFVDILKAFDSVPRKQIWQSLRKRGIKTKLKNNIIAIYEVTGNYVRKDKDQLEEFMKKKGFVKGGLKPYFVYNDHGRCCKINQVKNQAI